MKQRLNWLDLGKGLGMILVILGHANIPTPLRAFIYTFHMPLFFFLSGYLYSDKNIMNIRHLLRKKVNSLLVPYFSFAILSLVWYMYVIARNLPDFNTYKENLMNPILATILALRNLDYTAHLGALWFIVCLFITELLFHIIRKKCHSNKQLLIVIFLFSVLGYVYTRMTDFLLPWNIDVAFISVFFYGLGYLYKEKQQVLDHFNQYKWFFLLGIINIIIGYLNVYYTGSRIDMYSNLYGNFALFLISAVSGIGAFIILVKKVKSISFIIYIGRNSLIYLVLHQLFIFNVLDIIVEKFNLMRYYQLPLISGVIYTLVAILASVPVIYLINNHFSFIIGKKRKSNYNRTLVLKQ